MDGEQDAKCVTVDRTVSMKGSVVYRNKLEDSQGHTEKPKKIKRRGEKKENETPRSVLPTTPPDEGGKFSHS